MPDMKLVYHIRGVVGSHSGWLQPLYERVLWHNIGSVLGSVRLVIRLQMEPDTRRGKPQKSPFRSWFRSTSEMWIAIWLNKSFCSRTKAFVQAGSGGRLHLDPHFDPHSKSGAKNEPSQDRLAWWAKCCHTLWESFAHPNTLPALI